MTLFERCVERAVIGNEVPTIHVVKHVGPDFAPPGAAADIHRAAILVEHLILGHTDSWRAISFFVFAGGFLVVARCTALVTLRRGLGGAASDEECEDRNDRKF